MNYPPIMFAVYLCNEIMRVNLHESIRNMLKMFHSIRTAAGGIFKDSKYPEHVPSKGQVLKG